MEFKEIVTSKNLRLLLGGTIAVAVLVVVFCTGIVVGIEKTRFSYGMGESRYQAFAGPPGFFVDKNYENGHGLAGTILKISGETILVKNPQGLEKVIEVTNRTLIKKGRQDISTKDLKNNDGIIVIGSPGPEGEIEATLIRVMMLPPPSILK